MTFSSNLHRIGRLRNPAAMDFSATQTPKTAGFYGTTRDLPLMGIAKRPKRPPETV